VPNSENQPAYDLVEPLQLDDSVVLCVERIAILSNHYLYSSAQDLPMVGS
jgi:hypothetical protein